MEHSAIADAICRLIFADLLRERCEQCVFSFPKREEQRKEINPRALPPSRDRSCAQLSGQCPVPGSALGDKELHLCSLWMKQGWPWLSHQPTLVPGTLR